MINTAAHANLPRLTKVQWLICVIAAIGFAFDTYVLLMLPLILSNVDHEFATSHGIGNAEYVLAERRKGEWVCLQWGDEIIYSTGDAK